MTEVLLVLAQLGNDLSVRISDRLDLEELIHALEGHALGLRDEEVHEHNGAKHQRCKEEVDAVLHLGEHLGSEAGNEEVPEPVRRGGTSLGERTHVGVEHFRVENPGGTVPGWGVEDGPEIEEEHGCDAAAVHVGLRVRGGVGDLDVGTDDPETDGTTKSTDQEQVATTDTVNQVQKPDKGNDSLDDTEDTGGEHASVGTSDTNALEDGRGVVVDGVDTRAVLPEKEHASQEQAVHDFFVGGSSPEGLPEPKADRRALLFQGLVDGTNLLNNVDIVFGQLANPGQVLDGLLATTLRE